MALSILTYLKTSKPVMRISGLKLLNRDICLEIDTLVGNLLGKGPTIVEKYINKNIPYWTTCKKEAVINLDLFFSFYMSFCRILSKQRV